MKKELSKKILLMLCSVLFLPGVMGLSSVNANPTQSTGSSDVQKAVGVKRPRPSDSQETAGGEEATGMSTPPRTANKKRICPVAPKKWGLRPSFAVLAKSQELSKRFLNLFTEMCQMHGIDRTVYVEIPDVKELFYRMCFREELFSCLHFVEFKGYVKWFLEIIEEENELKIVIPLINEWLDNFVEFYHLNS